MTREEVYKLISGELDYAQYWDMKRKDPGFAAKLKGGAKLLDKDKPVECWILWMEHYLSIARENATRLLDKTEALKFIRKVAGLAVSCMMFNETPPRVLPNDYDVVTQSKNRKNLDEITHENIW